MAKTNYTKVEEALAEGMLKMEVNKLLNEADEYSGKGKSSGGEKAKIQAVYLQRLKKIGQDLKALEKRGKKPYSDLKLDKAEIERFLKDPSLLTEKEWEKVKQIKDSIEKYQEKEAQDEGLVNKEIKSQKTKRFNVKDSWIPLK